MREDDARQITLVIHVDIPANSADLRRSNSACLYSEFFRTIKSTCSSSMEHNLTCVDSPR